MARPLRIEYRGAFYHVMARGNEKKSIYWDNRDRQKYLSFLESSHQRYGAVFGAFCLMNNHYHLLLETPRGNLSEILHHINAGYTTYFNCRHKRTGHLLQGRFHSILVEKDSYVLELSRYIHLNPIRAGLVARPEEYPWSSYRYLISRRENLPYLCKETILSYFRSNAAHEYQQFIQEGMKKDIENPLNAAVASSILGSDDFVEWVKDTFIDQTAEQRDIPAHNALIRKPSIETIDQKVRQIIRDPGLARRVSVFLCHGLSGCRLKEIGGYFSLSESGVTLSAQRLKSLLKRDEDLHKTVEKLEMEIIQLDRM